MGSEYVMRQVKHRIVACWRVKGFVPEIWISSYQNLHFSCLSCQQSVHASKVSIKLLTRQHTHQPHVVVFVDVALHYWNQYLQNKTKKKTKLLDNLITP